MIPIVDSCVSLSQNNYTLNDYLSDASGFHVMRMVAVQQSPTPLTFPPPSSSRSPSVLVSNDANMCLEDAKYLQTQSTTRGSGGLPNGIVAYCDLSDSGSIHKLLDCNDVQNLRGFHQEFKPDVSLTIEDANDLLVSWRQSIAQITTAKLSIDITASIRLSAVLEAFACKYPDVNLVINVVVDINQDNLDFEQWLSLLLCLSSYTNVYLKLSCSKIRLRQSKIAEFSTFLTRAVSTFGAERILFASGLNASVDSKTFSSQWDKFVSAAEQLTARQRDRVFRLNAMGVYKL